MDNKKKEGIARAIEALQELEKSEDVSMMLVAETSTSKQMIGIGDYQTCLMLVIEFIDQVKKSRA